MKERKKINVCFYFFRLLSNGPYPGEDHMRVAMQVCKSNYTRKKMKMKNEKRMEENKQIHEVNIAFFSL